MKSINITASGALVFGAIGAALYFGSRLIPQTKNTLNFASEENVVSSTIDHITGINLYDTGTTLGGWIYNQVNPRSAP